MSASVISPSHTSARLTSTLLANSSAVFCASAVSAPLCFNFTTLTAAVCAASTALTLSTMGFTASSYLAFTAFNSSPCLPVVSFFFSASILSYSTLISRSLRLNTTSTSFSSAYCKSACTVFKLFLVSLIFFLSMASTGLPFSSFFSAGTLRSLNPNEMFSPAVMCG